MRCSRTPGRCSTCRTLGRESFSSFRTLGRVSSQTQIRRRGAPHTEETAAPPWTIIVIREQVFFFQQLVLGENGSNDHAKLKSENGLVKQNRRLVFRRGFRFSVRIGASVLRIKPTSSLPVLQIPILYYEISYDRDPRQPTLGQPRLSSS